MKGGEKDSKPNVIVKKNRKYNEKILKKLDNTRLEIMSNIIYRILSNKMC